MYRRWCEYWRAWPQSLTALLTSYVLVVIVLILAILVTFSGGVD